MKFVLALFVCSVTGLSCISYHKSELKYIDADIRFAGSAVDSAYYDISRYNNDKEYPINPVTNEEIDLLFRDVMKRSAIFRNVDRNDYRSKIYMSVGYGIREPEDVFYKSLGTAIMYGMTLGVLPVYLEKEYDVIIQVYINGSKYKSYSYSRTVATWGSVLFVFNAYNYNKKSRELFRSCFSDIFCNFVTDFAKDYNDKRIMQTSVLR